MRRGAASRTSRDDLRVAGRTPATEERPTPTPTPPPSPARSVAAAGADAEARSGARPAGRASLTQSTTAVAGGRGSRVPWPVPD